MQPPPTKNDGPAIWDLIIERMRRRDAIGRERYKTPLQAMNGRNALEDRIEEQLDALAYTVQHIEEMKNLGRELRQLILDEPCTNRSRRLAAIIERYPVLGE